MSSVTKGRSTLDEKLAKLSYLDLDDLIILSLMFDEISNVDICGMLRLTPPAISHRLNKYIDIFGPDFFEIVKNKKILSKTGKEFAKKARKALCSFLDVEDDLLLVGVKL